MAKKKVNELGFDYTPQQYGGGPNLPTTYASALQRWLDQQKKSGELFSQAAAPLTQAVNLFQPGGGYGAGQNVLIEDEARRAKAEALANMVATGMSSGSLATSTGLRIGSDMTKAKLGVQDTRTQFLADALSKLAGLRGTYASQVGTSVEPFSNQYMGNMTSISNAATGSRAGIINALAGVQEAKLASKKPSSWATDTPEKTPWDTDYPW